MAKMNSDIREWDFRYYVANSLMWQGEKRYTRTLYDMLHPPKMTNRSVEDMVDEVIQKTGIIVRKE